MGVIARPGIKGLVGVGCTGSIEMLRKENYECFSRGWQCFFARGAGSSHRLFFFSLPRLSNFRLQLPAFIVLKIVKDLKRYSTIVIELNCLASNAEMYRKMAPKFSVQKYLQHK
jgi:hypothetical protein